MDERDKTLDMYSRHASLALRQYDLPDGASARLISLSENATFILEAERPVAILRLYLANARRPDVVRSELAWIDAIRKDGAADTPRVLRTRNGEPMAMFESDGVRCVCAMFEYVPGSELKIDNPKAYMQVGRIAAQLHNHVEHWTPPAGFVRRTWDLEAILGRDADWGDWRHGPGLKDHQLRLLETVEKRLRDRLGHFPIAAQRGGLVHCDLRAANLILDSDERIWVIDFDDSGFSWFLWDLCSTTTFIEHLPEVNEIVHMWLRGYSQIRPLSEDDLKVIPDLVVLRRLHIFAWLGSHPEADLARSLGDTYCSATCEVAQRYLDNQFLADIRSSAY